MVFFYVGSLYNDTSKTRFAYSRSRALLSRFRMNRPPLLLSRYLCCIIVYQSRIWPILTELHYIISLSLSSRTVSFYEDYAMFSLEIFSMICVLSSLSSLLSFKLYWDRSDKSYLGEIDTRDLYKLGIRETLSCMRLIRHIITHSIYC